MTMWSLGTLMWGTSTRREDKGSQTDKYSDLELDSSGTERKWAVKSSSMYLFVMTAHTYGNKFLWSSVFGFVFWLPFCVFVYLLTGKYDSLKFYFP